MQLMMWNHWYGAWWMWVPASLLFLVIVGGIVVGIVLLARMSDSSNSPGATDDSAGPATGGSARRILGDRLARGDISVEEYRERVGALDDGNLR